jgi:hypothetical protein
MWISQRILAPGSMSLPASTLNLTGLADGPFHEETRPGLHVMRGVRQTRDACSP